MKTNTDSLPAWNLEPLYRGFEDPAYTKDIEETKEELTRFHDTAGNSRQALANPREWLSLSLELLNSITGHLENLESYTLCCYTTATTDKETVRRLNKIEEIAVPLSAARAIFRATLADLGKSAEELCEEESLEEYRYFISEELEFRKHQMSASEEDLATDLARSGAGAWERLHETLSSTESAVWDEKTGERKTAIQLRALAFDADRKVREKAYQQELEIWKRIEIPLAGALNGVKGHSITVNSRRGYRTTLERSLRQNRITGRTLEAMLQVMKESLPVFRRYLHTKARLLGLPRLAFFDLFAPLGQGGDRWDFPATRDFILKQFYSFSKEYGAFGENAFTENWIDAEPRKGKVGGAYCMSFPFPWESRILCNFDYSFNSVTTIAHELGHAYHHHTLQKTPFLLRNYPMTLAETASIFSENIIYGRLLTELKGKFLLPVLGSFLQDSCQVIVDIFSRFLFEKALFEKREKGEVAPDELCALMTDAQQQTYGDGLDPEALHPYMWAVKGHYYSHDLAFYNFPYAFGLLFGLALYGRYLEEGPDFAGRYRTILSHTGRASAVEVTRQAGFDIEQPEFWRSALTVITRRAEEFEEEAGR